MSKNTMARRSGFSAYVGRDIRLPASLGDDAEVERVAEIIAEIIAAATPASRSAQRVEIRTTCRLAFIEADTEERLRRHWGLLEAQT